MDICNVSLQFWCQDNAELIEWVGNDFTLFSFLSLFIIDIISSLNVWWNLPMKPSGLACFFVVGFLSTNSISFGSYFCKICLVKSMQCLVLGPATEVRCLWMSWVTGFPVWLVGTGSIPGPACGLGSVPSNPLEGSFPRLWQFHCTYELTTLLNTQRDLNRSLESSLCRSLLPDILSWELWLPPSPWFLNCSILRVLWALPGPLHPPRPCWGALSIQQVGTRAGRTSSVFHLSGITVFPCLMSSVLETTVPYILSFLLLLLFQVGGWSRACHSILARSRSRQLAFESGGNHEVSSWRGSVWLCQLHDVRENFQGDEER